MSVSLSIKATSFLLLSALASLTFANAGIINEQEGSVEIRRGSTRIASKINTEVAMNDVVATRNSSVGIIFRDNTRVKVNENSQLVIDEFVYDAQKSTGKLAVKVALGTVRYASGQVAKSQPQNVKISTPTAHIAVRGTDFTATVDELGRSMVILLPSCPVGFGNIQRDCKVGEIQVETEMGAVVLNQAFQSTYVASSIQSPSAPSILDITESQISNLLILTASETATTTMPSSSDSGAVLLPNALAVDFLSQNYLESNFLLNMLDANLLDSNLLVNALDKVETSAAPPTSSNNSAAASKTMPESVQSEGTVIKRVENKQVISIVLDKDISAQVNLQQDGVSSTMTINSGQSTISIRQSQ
jgi:hypothetical protein